MLGHKWLDLIDLIDCTVRCEECLFPFTFTINEDLSVACTYHLKYKEENKEDFYFVCK